MFIYFVLMNGISCHFFSLSLLLGSQLWSLVVVGLIAKDIKFRLLSSAAFSAAGVKRSCTNVKPNGRNGSSSKSISISLSILFEKKEKMVSSIAANGNLLAAKCYCSRERVLACRQ